MQTLLYLASNAGSIPKDRVSSTARKGLKWFQQVKVGDVVLMAATETGKRIGYAAVVAKEALSYTDVIANADHNHVGAGRSRAQAKERLAEELAAAYGDNKSYETFSVLHLLPLPQLDTHLDGIVNASLQLAATAKEAVAEAVGESVKSNDRARNAEYTAGLLMDVVAQSQDAAAQRVQGIGEDISGILLGVDTGEDATGIVPSAVERTADVGGLSITTRVEFDLAE